MSSELSGLEGSVVKTIKSSRELTDDVGKTLVKMMQKNLEDGDHMFSGTTYNSTGYDHETKTVKCLAPWSKVLEYGRRPGSHVPLEPLKKWIKTKQGLSDDEAEIEAKKLEQHIFKHGTFPAKFAKIAIIQLTGGLTPLPRPQRKKKSLAEKFYKKTKKLRKQTYRMSNRIKRLQ